MKKSRIFMAAGAALLAVTGVFATKANKKFTTETAIHIASTSLYGGTASFSVQGMSSLLSQFTNVAGSNPQVYLGIYTTGNNTPVAAFEILTGASTGTSPVYLK